MSNQDNPQYRIKDIFAALKKTAIFQFGMFIYTFTNIWLPSYSTTHHFIAHIITPIFAGTILITCWSRSNEFFHYRLLRKLIAAGYFYSIIFYLIHYFYPLEVLSNLAVTVLLTTTAIVIPFFPQLRPVPEYIPRDY